MSNPTVKTGTRLWSQEVAIARAATEVQTAQVGLAGVVALAPKDPGYKFSNGREFHEGKGPYA